MLRRRYLSKKKAMGKTEGRKEAHEGGGESRDPAGSLHGGSEEQRGRINRERKTTALVLLALMAIVPVLALYKGVAESDIRFLLSGGILLPLVSLTCALYWFGYRWAYTLSVYSAGVGLFCTFLYTVREGGGPAFLFLVPFVIAEYLLYRIRQNRTEEKEEKTGRTQVAVGLWLKENVEAIVIAFVMALVIRCFFIEVFKIPSSSMEPTLLGDYPTQTHPDCAFQHNHGKWPEGDRIMVMKYNYLLEDVERYDVLVFKFPLELSRNFIKRVVGLPEEEGFIFGGNWFVRSTQEEETRFRFARKPTATQKEIWIEPAASGHWLENRDLFLEDWSNTSETPFEILNGSLKTYEKPTRFELKEYLRDTDENPVWDVMIAFEITPSEGAVSKTEIRNELGTFLLSMGPEGYGLSLEGGETRTIQAPFPSDKKTRILFSVYDGQAILFINDIPHPPLQARTWYSHNLTLPRGARISFETTGKTVLHDLRIGRDLYYRGRSGPDGNIQDGPAGVTKTGPGQYIMFGDNVSNSQDSRLWKKHVYRMKDGSTIICEGQADKSKNIRMKESFRKRHGLDSPPDYYIQADWRGHARAFQREDLDLNHPQPSIEKFITVDRRHIVGKAFWVWWPPGRWFHMIR